MKRLLCAFLVLPLLVAAASASAAPGAQRLFVGFTKTPGAAERALVERYGGRVVFEFPEVSAFAVELSEIRVGELAREGAVSYVEQDPPREALGLAGAQLKPSMDNGLYGLITTYSTDVHSGSFPLSKSYTGTGIKACVADTGLDYTHGDIQPNYKGGKDTISNDNDPWWNNDPNETHGTHVAGTVMAANNSSGVYGVAYTSALYHARVLGPDGGTGSTVMAGVRWLVETAGCKIVNLSLGGGFKSRTEENFYKEMDSKGALIVAAAGNDAQTRLGYPAGYASVLSVAAVDSSNKLASFSNTGRGLDISGPGVMVLSSVPMDTGSEASVATSSSSYRAFGLEYAGKTGPTGTSGTIVDCGTGNTAAEFPAAVSGNIALMQRGTESFATKVENAMNAGAVAAIIYNNVSGDFTGTLGAATTSDGRAWIPAVAVSDTSGASLKSQAGSTGTVVNQVSSWDHYSGTSMATPHVSGVAALVWSVDSGMTDDTVEDHLKKTATDLGAPGYDTTYGYGLVNAKAAVIKAGG